MSTSPYACCPEACLVGEDDFNREDSNDPGCNWVEIAGGSYAIESGTLTGSGFLITKRRNPLNTVNAVVHVDLIDTPGNTFKVVVGFIDPSNYLYAKFAFGSGNVTVSLHQVAGGTDTELKSEPGLSPDNPFPAFVCLSAEGNFTAGSQAHEPITVCSPGVGSPPATIGNVGFNGGTFDDWKYWEHHVDNEDCPYCDCTCEETCLPDTLTVTFLDIQYCSCFDGWSFVLNRDVNPKNRWVLTNPVLDPNLNWLEQFRIECIEDHPDINVNGKFAITDWDGAVGEATQWQPTAGAPSFGSRAYPDSTCTPLKLLFGPFYVGAKSGPVSFCCDAPIPESGESWIWVVVTA